MAAKFKFEFETVILQKKFIFDFLVTNTTMMSTGSNGNTSSATITPPKQSSFNVPGFVSCEAITEDDKMIEYIYKFICLIE
jgi:hypothetical protein